jgi:hypothetical protein
MRLALDILALVTGATGAALSIWNAFRVKSLERFKSELKREEAGASARLDYEYEARKRLYATFEPAVFQLLELCRYAVGRITSLTDPDLWENLLPGEDDPAPEARRPPMGAANYNVISTLHGLFAPLVIVRGMRRGLTLLDLSLEPRIHLQYELASAIYDSFSEDTRLATLAPALDYDPSDKEWRRLRQSKPEKYWWQGLTMGRLERILDALTAMNSSADEPPRVVTFGEFEELYITVAATGSEIDRKNLAVAANALLGFRPEKRPVFWRMMIVQARLYQALMPTKEPDFRPPQSGLDWEDLLRLDDQERFRWRTPIPGAPDLEGTLPLAATISKRNSTRASGLARRGDIRPSSVRRRLLTSHFLVRKLAFRAVGPIYRVARDSSGIAPLRPAAARAADSVPLKMPSRRTALLRDAPYRVGRWRCRFPCNWAAGTALPGTCWRSVLPSVRPVRGDRFHCRGALRRATALATRESPACRPADERSAMNAIVAVEVRACGAQPRRAPSRTLALTLATRKSPTAPCATGRAGQPREGQKKGRLRRAHASHPPLKAATYRPRQTCGDGRPVKCRP